MAHANNADLTMKSGQALDESVALARDFAEANPDTLVITVGDHETGGLAAEQTDDPEYPDESGGNQCNENANLSTEDDPFDVANSGYKYIMDWTTTGHTAVYVILTATGPGTEFLTGNYKNTYVYDVMAGSLGVAGLSPAAGAAVEAGKATRV